VKPEINSLRRSIALINLYLDGEKINDKYHTQKHGLTVDPSGSTEITQEEHGQLYADTFNTLDDLE
jgi:hypothetical protein